MKYSNLSYLKDVSRGNNKFVLKTIDSFIEQVLDALPEMERQLADKDWDGLSSLMHRMKPCLDIMGIASLKNTVVTLENCAANKINLNDVTQLVEKLKQTFQDVLSELEIEKQSINQLIFH
jgi:HPt (histidine-containing phosphotransfer) domain-containing protein